MTQSQPPCAARRVVSRALIAVSWASACFSFRAAPASAEAVPADELFQQGKGLMEQGSIAQACEKFAASLALARRGGTLLNLAVCREQEGRYASALRLFGEARDFAVKDGRAERVTLADEHLTRVRSLVSWLTVIPVSPGARAALSIQCDQVVLERASWGAPQTIDPGEHEIAASEPGRARFSVRIVIGKTADSQSLSIPELAELPAPSSPPVRLPPGHSSSAAVSPNPEPSQRSSGKRLGAWIALGAGGVMLAVGGVFGVKAIIDSQRSHELCATDSCQNDEAYAKNHDAYVAARVADVTIPAGALLTAAGLYFLLQPRAADASRSPARSGRPRLVPTLGRNQAGATLEGTW